jgi:hypothetical protein
MRPRSVIVMAALMGQGLPAAAATCTSVAAGGNWNVVATWAGSCAGGNGTPPNTPGPADNVTIDGNTAPVNVNLNAQAASLTINPAGNDATLTHTGTNSLTVGGAVIFNAPSAGNNIGSWFINAGSATVGGNVTLNGGGNDKRINTIIITTGTLTIGGGLSLVTDSAVRAAIDMSGGAGTLNLAGAFTINTAGTLTPGPTSTFNFNGTAAQTIPIGVSAVVYNNLHVNNTSAAGATPGAAITAANVTGNLRVQSGMLANGGFAIAGGGTDTFQVANGATFRMTGTAVFPTGYGTYTFGPTSTVQYRQTNAQTVSAQTYGHLEVTPAANSITHTFAAGTTTVAGNLTVGNGANTGVIVTAATNSTTLNVSGNVSISANTTLTAHGSNAFTVGGNWTRTGTFTHNNGTVTFNGSAAQAINGATTFRNLTVANTSAAVTANAAHTVAGTLTLNASSQFADGGNTIMVNGNVANSGTHSGAGSILLTGGGAAHQLSGNGSYGNLQLNEALGATLTGSPTVTGTLTLTLGDITTGANTLTIGSAGSISGAGTASHVVGNLAKAFAAAGSFTYAVGDGTNYTPVTVNFSSLTTPGNLTASVTNTDHPDTTAGTSGADSVKSINRYWTLKGSTLAGTSSATLNYINGTPVDRDATAIAANFIIRRGASCSGSGAARTCTTWSQPALGGVPTTTQAQATGLVIASGDPESDLAAGELLDLRFLRERQFIYTRELY